jgi:protein ImuA
MHGIDPQRGASPSRAKTLAVLRRLLAKAGDNGPTAERAARFALGAPGVDAFLGGGLGRACLHEIHAPWSADWSAAAGFSLAMALRAASGRPLFWARQDFLEGEAGRLNGVGLAEFGVDPVILSLVRGRDAEAVLRAGVEAARCKSLGAALIEIFGAPRALDLTATLRLARAAEASGVTVFLLRIRAGQEAAQETGIPIGPLAGTQAKTGPPPSAAASRWRARAQNSRALAANAPGAPCFSVTLLRHRGGAADRSWRLEWLRDRGLFHEAADSLSATLSGPVAAVPADRQIASGLERGRRATG